MKRETIIHIGLHKSASTFLQNNVFPILGEVNYIDRSESWEVLKPIIFQSHSAFDPIDIDQNRLDSWYAPGKRVVISEEFLSGNPDLGYINQDSCLENLHQIFPDAKVIIVLREQWSLIRSMYLHMVATGYNKHEKRAFNFDNGNPDGNYINPKAYMYSRILKRLLELYD